MNVLIIASVIIAATVVIGVAAAFLFSKLGDAVQQEQESMKEEQNQYKPALTMGYKIPIEADYDKQLQEAISLAAKRAAVTPRGENLRIGSFGEANQPTATDGIQNDPFTAVKIAKFHSWEWLASGAIAHADTEKPAKAAAQTAPPAKTVDDLVPGEDYPYIEITDDMSPAEVRKARIANAKAKSAAVKELKAAAPAPAAQTPVDGESVEESRKTASAPAKGTAIKEPVPGVDYQVIEITDDMEPAEVRKARIANAKAKSAAMKAFKEAGGLQETQAGLGAAETETPASETAQAPSGDEKASVEIPADIPRPEFIEISDDMDPGEIRKARIENAKARSSYLKALKDAGIDPSTVDI